MMHPSQLLLVFPCDPRDLENAQKSSAQILSKTAPSHRAHSTHSNDA